MLPVQSIVARREPLWVPLESTDYAELQIRGSLWQVRKMRPIQDGLFF
jgi:hypothetical protein